jgi:predicted RNA-binding protein
LHIAFSDTFIHNAYRSITFDKDKRRDLLRRETMCDINVFVRKNGIEENVLENVDLVESSAEGIRLVNIFGEERLLQAKMILYNNSEKRMVFQPI